jgi:CheY-like chemotaxis protein
MILLVEDNEDDVFIMERALMKLPLAHKLYIAEHGGVAIDYLGGAHQYSDRISYPIPDLILLDLKMPVANGFDVLNWLNTQPQLKDIPVVILTSSSEPKDRQKADQLGAKTLLVKPPTPEMLSHVFAQFLKKP